MKRASALAMLVSCGVVVAACNTIFGLEEGVLGPTGCADASECDDANPCTIDQCLQGSCVSLGGPSVAVSDDAQQEGDCLRLACDVDGNVKEVVDDEDLPTDANDCTLDECRSGERFNTALDLGSSCNGGDGLCDAEGNCGECLTAANCPPSGFCVTYACEMGQCTASFTAAGTRLPTDIAGDCQHLECDGAGSTLQVEDIVDVPVDGNPCTQDLCVGSPAAPNNPPATNGIECNGGNGQSCQAGVCIGCTLPTDCDSSDSDCSDWSCNTGTNQCEVAQVPNGQPGALSQTSGDCQQRVCNGNGGVSIVNDNDPFNDNNACTADTCSDGTPIHTDQPLNTSCGTGGMQFCNAAGMCVECNSGPQCPAGANECQYAECLSNMCTLSNRANGYVLSSQTSGDCKTAVCDGNGNVSSNPANGDEPADDGNECTDDTCSGGVPVHPELTGPACSSGFCSSGACVGCFLDMHCPTSGECCNLTTNSCVTSGCAMGSS